MELAVERNVPSRPLRRLELAANWAALQEQEFQGRFDRIGNAYSKWTAFANCPELGNSNGGSLIGCLNR